MNLHKQLKRLQLGVQHIRKALPGHRPDLYYVVPEVEWAVSRVGSHVTSEVSRQFGLPAQLIQDPRWLSGQIIHYGSMWAYVGNIGSPHNDRNLVVATVFHGDRQAGKQQMTEGIERVLGNIDALEILVVSNSIMRSRFIGWGVNPQMLRQIAIGVDANLFRPASQQRRALMRQKLGIPDDAVCIGSFQKDGEGWDEGLEPKLMKGPDVFLEAIQHLGKRRKLHVMLTGPARGYVKSGLSRLAVPYSHANLENYAELVDYYAALDAYMVSSREEGGPKGVLESLATGIPLVSTKVGQAPDIVEHEQHGLLVENEDAAGLADALERLLEDRELREAMRASGIERAKAFDWAPISAQYYREIYQPLIEAQKVN